MPAQQAPSTARGHGQPGTEQDYRRSQPGNPYAATEPRGHKPYDPGRRQRARLPSGTFDQERHGRHPVDVPASHVWQETSSSEYWRTHTERPSPRGAQGAPEHPIGLHATTHLIAPDPKWTPEPPIRTVYAPAASQLIGRPFDQRKTHRMSGEHGSMAGQKRSYQLIKGERPVHRATTTYRIVPPTQEEQRAAAAGQPTLSVQPMTDRSQNGTWRLP